MHWCETKAGRRGGSNKTQQPPPEETLVSNRRSWFGPSKEDIWKQLAAEIRANYVQSGWSGAKVQAQHGEWTITLDTYADTQIVNDVPVSNDYTRMRAPYVNRDGFRF